MIVLLNKLLSNKIVGKNILFELCYDMMNQSSLQ